MLRLSLCALLAAGGCGKIKTVQPGADASPDDGDGAPDDTPGEVTLELYQQFEPELAGDPLADQPVLWFGPDLELIEETETDDDGKTSAVVPPGSVVVIPGAFTGKGTSYATLAIFDLQPGDELVFRSPEEPDTASVGLGTMTIEVPALTDKTLSYYRADNGCGSINSESNMITGLSFSSDCVSDDGEFQVLVRAFDTMDNVINVTSKRDTFAAAGTSTIASWRGVDDLELAVTAIPDELHELQFELAPSVGDRTFGETYGGFFEATEDSIDHSMGKLDTFGDRLNATIEYRPIQSNLLPQEALHVLAPDASELPLALDEELLPWFAPPVFTESDQRVSWHRVGGGSPDAIYTYMLAQKKAAAGLTFWIAVVPPDWDSVELPHLPDEYAENRMEDIAQFEVLMRAIDVNHYDGYEIRSAGIVPLVQSIEGVPETAELGTVLKVSPVGGF